MKARFRPCSLLRRTSGPARIRALCAAAAACCASGPAEAHIKWFEPYDVTQAPVPLGDVFTRQYLLALVGFAFLMVGGFVLDRLAAPARWSSAGLARQDSIEVLLRAAVGAFFVALFTMGGIILTPELKTGAAWPAWVQLGIAASMLSPRSCALGSLGLLLLYGYAVWLYGAFHLADYPIFLGLAAWMALTSCRDERLRALRMPVLYVAFCTTMMWGAVEKWAYPQWTHPLLADRPYLTLGIPVDAFMVLAGFVEFALAFYILTGLGLLRLGIFALGAIFAGAIIDFGKMDAIGHLPIVAALAAMFLHGPTPLHRALHDAARGPLAEARRAGALFLGALAVFFLAYYGLQRGEYGHGPAAAQMAALPSPR